MSEERGASQSLGIGGFARRLGRWVSDVSDAVSFPESLRSAIEQAFQEQANGQLDKAARTLLNVSVQRNVGALAASAEVLLALAHLDPMPPAVELNSTVRESLGKLIEEGKAGAIVQAIEALEAGELDSALDGFRRQSAKEVTLPPEVSAVRKFVLSLWSAKADLRYGRFARALLELDRVNEHLLAVVSNLRAPLCVSAAEMAIQSALHQGDLESLAQWTPLLERILTTQPGDLGASQIKAWENAKTRATELAARVQISQGEPSIKTTLPSLALGEMHLRAEIAGLLPSAHEELPPDLQDSPKAWRLHLGRRLRRWAQEPSREAHRRLKEEFVSRLPGILEELEQAEPDCIAELCSELALFSLAAGHHEIDWGPWVKKIHRANLPVPAALHMARCLAQRGAEQNEDQDQAQQLKTTIALASSALTMGNERGYDESSPLRWPTLRDPVLFGVLSFLRGQSDLLAERNVQAEHHFAHALASWPYLDRAQRALDRLQSSSAEPTLEAQLQALADQLIPQSSEPVEVQRILKQCQHTLISERERLSRPFTLAVMGEFSAGKSTFVNALIGREVAPMGVLPTTNTVNRFRHGKGTIRVHYENGKVEYIDAQESHHFLDNIDETQAKAIQYLDIEGDFEQLADLVIVDTPGLNATQAHHERITRSFVDQADSVLWIFSATRAGASTESAIIESLQAESRPILGLLNKTDTISQEEQEELLEYLRDQFGDQLLDIVPICASKALASRQHKDDNNDRTSLEAIQASLREHLLDKTPEHKHDVAQRQSIRALETASTKIRELILRNEQAQDTQEQSALQEDLERDLLAIQDTWLDLDRFLVRVALDLGIAASGRGRVLEQPPEQDRRYLHRRAKHRFFAQLDAMLSPQIEGDEPSAPSMRWNHWARPLRDWLDGYWAGLEAQDSLCKILLTHAPQAKQSERSYQEAVRAALLECSGSFAQASHPLAKRMQGWLRASLSEHSDGRGDPDAYLSRVLLPKLLAGKRALQG